MVSFSRAANIVAAALTLALVACSDRVTSPPDPLSSETSAPAPAGELAADSVAHGLALALASPTLRQQVLEDLRDSPFHKHGIHLQSYLRGARGRNVAAAGAQTLGIPVDHYLELLKGMPQLQLSIPRSLDRVTWSGAADIVVFATTSTLAERVAVPSPERGYTVHGEAVQIDVWAHPTFPFLAITPSERSFGADAEAVRAAAPKHARATVSTRAEEIAAITVDAENGGGGAMFHIQPDPCELDNTCGPPPPAKKGELIP
jgi:hypothetical protein